LRLAVDVHHRRDPGGACRLPPGLLPGIAALARLARPDRGSRSGDEEDRAHRLEERHDRAAAAAARGAEAQGGGEPLAGAVRGPLSLAHPHRLGAVGVGLYRLLWHADLAALALPRGLQAAAADGA